jgi:putative FmdB family regulatory protein
MPTYEYKCDACGNAFERFQPITSAAIKKCPKCGKNKVRRLIGIGSGMIFKGSGFYTTDYRDSSYKDKAKADSPASGSSGETKPEGKPESKTETKPTGTEPAAKPTESKPPAAKAEPKASKSAKKK